MTDYSVTQAARAVGRDRSSVRRAIAAGRLSAARDEASGEWRIEASELHRAYPGAPAPGASGADAPSRPDGRPSDADARLADAHATIEDLRRRLDVATEQLGALQARLLTDQRPRRRWWSWR